MKFPCFLLVDNLGPFSLANGRTEIPCFLLVKKPRRISRKIFGTKKHKKYTKNHAITATKLPIKNILSKG